MGKARVDLLVTGLRQAVTLAGPPGPRAGVEGRTARLVSDAAIAVHDGRVVEVGPAAAIARSYEAARELDAGGRVALPGFVDAHTHAVYAAPRADEWEERLAGVSYQAIAARGGGIRSSVRRLRAASADELFQSALPRLDRMLATGTTTVEIKSGYGLSVEDEVKTLEVARRLGEAHPLTVVPTFMGAHEIPDEYRGDREGYIRLVCEVMLPRAASLARYCDVFCEDHVFTVDESRRILEAGKRVGLAPKIHADELASTGGAELAAEVGAISADHLLCTSEAGARAMAAAGVIGVLLPGTAYFLRLERRPPIDALRAAGVALALATDANPGSCPTESMAMVLSLACQRYGLAPAEALIAATVNAAHAIGEGARRGSLEPGKQADIVIHDADDWREVPFRFGVSLVHTVLIAGAPVYSRPPR